MRARGLAKRIRGRDRHAHVALVDRASQQAEFLWAGHGIVPLEAHGRTASRFRLDAVGIHQPSSPPHEIQARVEVCAAREREHGIQSICGNVSKTRDAPLASHIDDVGRAETADESFRGATGRRTDHTRAALCGQLHGDRADCPGGAKDQDRLTTPKLQGSDALKRGQTRGCDNARRRAGSAMSARALRGPLGPPRTPHRTRREGCRTRRRTHDRQFAIVSRAILWRRPSLRRQSRGRAGTSDVRAAARSRHESRHPSCRPRRCRWR